MKNAFLSFLESFASSRSAAALDRNRDAFFVKGRAKLTNGVSLRRPQTSIRQSASSAQESASRRSGSYSFVSTRSKVKFLLFFRIVGNFTNFPKKSQDQTTRNRQYSVDKNTATRFKSSAPTPITRRFHLNASPIRRSCYCDKTFRLSVKFIKSRR